MTTKQKHLLVWPLAGLLVAVLLLLFLSSVTVSRAAHLPEASFLTISPAKPPTIAADGFITGVVTADDGGGPLSSVQVCATDIDFYQIQCEYTGATGVYSIGVPGGVYKVSFTPNDYHITECYDDAPCYYGATYTPITVTNNTVVSNINASLAAGHQIHGHTFDSISSLPIDGIYIYVSDADSRYHAYSYSDSSGTYVTVPGLPSGTYRVRFADNSRQIYATEYYNSAYNPANATWISVSADVYNLDAAMIRGAAITGFVTVDGGNPLTTADLSLELGSSQTLVDRVSANSSGYYQFRGLGPITYTIYAGDSSGHYLPEWYQDADSWGEATIITLSIGTTTTVNFELSPAGIITGVVRDETTGNPLPGIHVTLLYSDTGLYAKNDSTDSAGRYTLDTITPGWYKLRFSDNSLHYVEEYYDDKNSLTAADPISIANGTLISINVALSPEGFITGTVTDEQNGTPLPNILVGVYYSDTGNYIGSYSTDGAGHYRIGSLAAETYKLYFSDPAGRYLDEYYDNKDTMSAADPITVTAGATTTVNVALAAGGAIVGTVSDDISGTPLPGIRANLYYSDTGNYITGMYTNGSGDYQFTGLTPGMYKLRLYDPAGRYLDEYYDNKNSLSTADPISVTGGMTSTANIALTLSGVVSGTVTSESDGAPIQGISVRLYNATTDSYARSSTTNSSGQYLLTLVPPGPYKLYFDDYSNLYLDEYYNDKPDYESADVITVTGGVTTTANAALTRGCIISGTITSADNGTPLNDIRVSLYNGHTGAYITNDYSDPSGHYRFSGLNAGTYKLYFYDYNYIYLPEYYDNRSSFDEADLITVTASGTATINVTLDKGGVIAGRVTAADTGLGIHKVYVNAWRMDDGHGYRSQHTDTNGYYKLTGLPAGVYRVSFDGPQPYYDEYYDNWKSSTEFTPVTVTQGITTANINAVLSAGPLITGRVTGSGPLVGVKIYAYLGDNPGSAAYDTTDSNGFYEVGPLDAGQYRLKAQPDDIHVITWYSDTADYSNATFITVISTTVTNINFHLATGSTISGTVTAADTGLPIPNAVVYLYPYGISTQLAYKYTDYNGHYILRPALAPGSYQIKFHAPSGYQSEWYSNAADQSQATAIHVTSGTTLTIDAQLSPVSGSGTITGTVTAADTGLPLNCWVYAKDASGSNIGSDYSDSHGRYEIPDLQAGTYRLYFSPYSPYVPIYYGGTDDLSAATPVTVTAGVTVTHIDQAIPRGATITGTVDDGTTGIPGVYVYAWRVSGSYATGSIYTGPDGSYRLEGLPSGAYKVLFDPAPPFRQEWYRDKHTADDGDIISVTVNTVITGINATLETGGIITGRITAADTGLPMAQAFARIYDESGQPVQTGLYANRDGYYTSFGLPDGNYRVKFDSNAWQFYRDEWYGGVQSSGDSPTITVTSSAVVTGINGQLDRGGSISGIVRDAHNGIPLSSVWTVAYDASTEAYVAADYTNPWGLYQITQLPDGDYKVYFSKSGYGTEWYDDAPDSATAVTVTVHAPDDTPDIDADLSYPYEIYLPLVLRDK